MKIVIGFAYNPALPSQRLEKWHRRTKLLESTQLSMLRCTKDQEPAATPPEP
jgi:hypothetical protein